MPCTQHCSGTWRRRANEWHGPEAASGNDPATANAVADLERAVRVQAVKPGLGTPVSTELLSSVDTVTTDRRARLASAAKQLPVLYVITFFISGGVLIANAGVLTVRVHRRGALVISGLTIVIGLSVALILALENPWEGSIVVSGSTVDPDTRHAHKTRERRTGCAVPHGPNERSARVTPTLSIDGGGCQ